MKNTFIILFLVALLGVKISLQLNEVEVTVEVESYAGSKEYWKKRVGIFDSDEAFVKAISKARKQIKSIPKRRTLGLNWKELGPDNIGGRTRSILIDNENHNLIYAGGVAGGLWYSEDAGLTWNQTTPGDNAEVLTVNCITQDELGYIYYGTGEGVFYGDFTLSAPGTGGLGFRGKGIFRSTEPHGKEFMHLEDSWIGKETETVAVNALSSDQNGNVYAGAKGELLRSSDKGVNWSSVSKTADFFAITGVVYDVKALSDGTVILAMGNEYYLSPNGDAFSFTKISSPSGILTPATGRSVIAVAPSDENVIYISRAGSDDIFDGLFRSKDKGQTWEKIIGGGGDVFKPFTGGGGQGNYDQCLAVFPNNPNKILLGGIEIYEWEEGQNWNKLSQWSAGWGDANYVHADAHAFAFHPTDPTKYYIATDGGIFITKDNGAVFQRLNRGYNVTQYYGVAFGGDGVILAGTQDNSNTYIDFNGNTALSAELHNSGDGGQSAISNLMPNAFFLESQYGKIRRDNSRTGSYSDFFYHPDAAIMEDDLDYDYRWNEFIAPLTLWESNRDVLVPDTALFIAAQDYSENDVLTVNSNINGLSYLDTLDSDLYEGDTLRSKVPTQSMFVYGSHQAVYITRNAIDFSANPKWIELSNEGCYYYRYSNGYGPTALAVSSDGDEIYYGTDRGEVYRVSNVSQVISDETVSNATVTKIAEINKSGTFSDSYITDIAVDPNDKEHVIVTVGYYDQTTNIFVSTTAASTTNDNSFVSIAGNLPQIPVYSALIEEASGVYIIGTEFGLFSSSDNGVTWFQELDGPPQCPATMIRQQVFKGAENRGQIYVATHGRGIFTTQDYETSIEGKQDLQGNMNLQLFPNPANQTLNIRLKSNSQDKLDVKIINNVGQLVLSETVLSSSIDVSRLAKGTYVLTAKQGENLYSSKFIKK